MLDNLSEGVLKPDIYDPALNPLYRDVLAHYGAVALPCRVADPDRKGKVERGVGHAKNTPLKGQRFESLEEAQAYLDHWEAKWADTRIHGTVKRQVAAMFAEEKPALLPLPLEPFRQYQFGDRRVNLDGCVEVDAAYYSAPPGWIGRSVKVQWDGHVVRVLDPRFGPTVARTLAPAAWRASDPRTRTSPRTRHAPPLNYWRVAPRSGLISARSPNTCTERGARVEIRRIIGMTVAWRASMAPRSPTMPAPPHWKSGIPANPYGFVRRWLERGLPSRFARSIPSSGN